jgi:membrane protease YdiL (CAAX protease family)
MALPFLVVGGIITVVLMVVTQFLIGTTPTPSHPAQQAAVDADAWQVIQLFLLASVAAPVVEEIMFRGVFFTHLCGWTRRWSRWLGIIFAVFVSSVIFAAIHPQGPIFIPPLAGLAIGFCVARLWRGSLIPAMVAHGVSNALVMGLNVMLFSS